MFSSPTLSARFAKYWMPEPNSGCWLWLGAGAERAILSSGVGGKPLLASHVSLFLHKGQHVPKGMYACHHCDNGLCVNPEHLFVGTPRDNAMDMINKGRYGGPPKVTHCRRGHEYNEQNTLLLSSGGRQCRACHRLRALQSYHADIAANRVKQNEQKRLLKAKRKGV